MNLRDRITVMRPTRTNSGGAQKRSDPVAVSPLRMPAGVESVSGERVERIFGSQQQTVGTHLITARAVEAVQVADYVLWHQGDGKADRVLEIRGRQLVGTMRTLMVLACEERNGAA